MKPAAIIETFSLMGPQELHVYLRCLADQVNEATLANGKPLTDRLDFDEWLVQLAMHAELECRLRQQRAHGLGPKASSASSLPPAQPRWGEKKGA
jgi:hypothetical protein